MSPENSRHLELVAVRGQSTSDFGLQAQCFVWNGFRRACGQRISGRLSGYPIGSDCSEWGAQTARLQLVNGLKNTWAAAGVIVAIPLLGLRIRYLRMRAFPEQRRI